MKCISCQKTTFFYSQTDTARTRRKTTFVKNGKTVFRKLLENGTAVTTTKSIKFVLFNSLTGGTPLYAAA